MFFYDFNQTCFLKALEEANSLLEKQFNNPLTELEKEDIFHSLLALTEAEKLVSESLKRYYRLPSQNFTQYVKNKLSKLFLNYAKELFESKWANADELEYIHKLEKKLAAVRIIKLAIEMADEESKKSFEDVYNKRKRTLAATGTVVTVNNLLKNHENNEEGAIKLLQAAIIWHENAILHFGNLKQSLCEYSLKYTNKLIPKIDTAKYPESNIVKALKIYVISHGDINSKIIEKINELIDPIINDKFNNFKKEYEKLLNDKKLEEALKGIYIPFWIISKNLEQEYKKIESKIVTTSINHYIDESFQANDIASKKRPIE
ncbi:MAG: hypothetical protein HQK78_10720, partial [Desulfobacterales bacterium]|nr:hypothetical protein [Desulfobacterales bacterium]